MALKKQKIKKRSGVSLVQELVARVKHDQLKDVPPWYRSNSAFQKNAVNNIFYALRDDAEQNTTHRIRACLVGAGIFPMITDKELKQLIVLSRLSDLAFLWFLWELHYKSNGKYEYQLNEQIILTSIAHLDMITTMRELDRILPPGHAPKKVLNRRLEKIDQEKRQKEKRRLQRMKPKKEYPSPYFKPLERQRPYGKSLFVDPPDFRVVFPGYEAYKDPNHIVVNESTRWFSSFTLRPEARITKKIINTELNKVFEKIRNEKNAQSTGHNIDAVIDKNEQEALCATDREAKLNKKLLKTEKFLKMRDKCLKSLKVSYKKKLQVQCLFDSLKKDVESYQKTLREKAKPPENQKQVNIIGKECFCEYVIQDPGDDEEECQQPDLYLCVNEEGEVARVSSYTKVNQPNDPESQFKNGEQERLRGGAEGITIKKPNMDEVPKNVISGTAEHRKSNVSIASNIQYHETSQNSEIESPELTEQFFISPQEHKPYEFDYCKIFKFISQNDEEKLKLKHLDALDCDVKDVKKLLDESPDIMDAVSKCALKTWKDLMVIQREKELEKELEKALEEERQKKTDRPILSGIPVKEFYDCDDNELMDNMLKEALRVMSKNPKFVLASLKDAYKMPVLRQWISSRYGKTYSKAERLRSYKLSLKIFRALEDDTPNYRIPIMNDLGRNWRELDYSCQRYVAKKAAWLKEEARKELARIVMDQTRIVWLAMRPYLCYGGPPRHIYFAYAPSRIQDISVFRPWKPYEYMNASLHWHRRQMAKSRKERLSN